MAVVYFMLGGGEGISVVVAGSCSGLGCGDGSSLVSLVGDSPRDLTFSSAPASSWRSGAGEEGGASLISASSFSASFPGLPALLLFDSTGLIVFTG